MNTDSEAQQLSAAVQFKGPLLLHNTTAVFLHFGGNSGTMVTAEEPNQQKRTSPGASEV